MANALRIVHDGAVELFNAGESGSAGDLCILYCSGLDEMKNAEEYAKLAPTLHQQSQRMHMLTLQHLHVDQPERDQFEKVCHWFARINQSEPYSASSLGAPHNWAIAVAVQFCVR